MDYTDRKRWWDLIQKYAIAQQDYPNGIGLNNVLRVKAMVVKECPLEEVSPSDLSVIMKKCREKYLRIKSTYDNDKSK